MRARNRRGANAIEFALVFPILLAMITSVMDLSFAMGLRYAASVSAQYGARLGASTPRDEDPEGIALAKATET